ncbi:cysteine desulfurase family protein [Parasporobacterium paucivorans]|uniref:Cysteine desulfurase n=1 Tax=Parasporobacterium paucivorans DSM 15970 TaxID=1122934 RepID=A0A1M6GI50_9FIRM|nr:cysteine desulfurase family protein [Parasporobacterium paucivorans]SHJ09572.1 cysteine desulfurase [Parasporobacterium paucivorans DSM 15970]
MGEKVIYLDNAAATKLDEAVFEEMKSCFFEKYAVATSEFGYSQGIEAREILLKARTDLAACLGADPEEMVFTSGNAESGNLALKGVAGALGEKKGKHIIVSKIEDFPVLHSAKTLEKQGFKVDYLDVDEFGFIDMGQLEKRIGADTILVSVQHANQEIGTVQDIEKIGKLCRERDVLFHTDATHTFTRIPIDVNRVNADLVTISAHTIHGPKGIGGLYVRKGTPLMKLMDGGFQEFDHRGGIENIPGAVGFAKAARLVTPEENLYLQAMQKRITELVFERIPLVTLNGHPEKRIPQNANITFHHVEGESITLHLDMYGIAVSTGSACFSRSLEASHVMMAIGGDHERAHGSIRFSFGRFNSMEEVGFVVEKLEKIIENLRRISPLGKRGGN